MDDAIGNDPCVMLALLLGTIVAYNILANEPDAAGSSVRNRRIAAGYSRSEALSRNTTPVTGLRQGLV